MHRSRGQRGDRTRPSGSRRVYGGLSLGVALLFMLISPVYANGGHVHLEGVFFLLLGGVVFVGGLVVILYFLFRSDDEQRPEQGESE